jgi:predicted nucleotidyltransferase
MLSAKSLDDLVMPDMHKAYLSHPLDYIQSYPVVQKVILFGSCASGDANSKSDIDIMLLGENITDDDEWDIVCNCPEWEDVERIAIDILSCTFDKFAEMSQVPGMLQRTINKKGVDLSELLHAG